MKSTLNFSTLAFKINSFLFSVIELKLTTTEFSLLANFYPIASHNSYSS